MPEEFRVFHESHYDPIVSVILPDSIDSEKIPELRGQAMDLAANPLQAAGIKVEKPHREYSFDTEIVEAINSPFVQEHLFFNNTRRAVKAVKDLRAARRQAA